MSNNMMFIRGYAVDKPLKEWDHEAGKDWHYFKRQVSRLTTVYVFIKPGDNSILFKVDDNGQKGMPLTVPAELITQSMKMLAELRSQRTDAARGISKAPENASQQEDEADW